MIKIVTHSGSFHPDDVFAVATLELFYKDELIEIVRTRDEDIIKSADVVVDVGREYDHEKKRYDHHQNGAPIRDNRIPYAGFGLVWKHYGEAVSGNAEVATSIEEKLVQPVDAGDNGVSLYKLNELNIAPFELYNLVSLFSPPWGSGESKDEAFAEAVGWAKRVISQMIIKETANCEMENLIGSVYEDQSDKSVLVFDVPVPMVALIKFSDVKVVVCPDDPLVNSNWTATAVRKDVDTFESKVSFPENWAGLQGEALQKVSSITDAVFCHKAGFFFAAGSKEGALRAVEFMK